MSPITCCVSCHDNGGGVSEDRLLRLPASAPLSCTCIVSLKPYVTGAGQVQAAISQQSSAPAGRHLSPGMGCHSLLCWRHVHRRCHDHPREGAPLQRQLHHGFASHKMVGMTGLASRPCTASACGMLEPEHASQRLHASACAHDARAMRQRADSTPDLLGVQVCKKTVQQKLPPMGKLSHASGSGGDPQTSRQVQYGTDYRREDDDQTEIPSEEKTRSYKVGHSF